MKIKTFIRIIFISILSFFLSSCSFIGFINDSTPNEPIELKEYAGQNITLKMLNEASEIICLDATGNQNILVLPVCFKDFNLKKLNLNENEVIGNLNDAFFGTSEDTGWESVSSYYKKSSYGKLQISGEVAPIYTLDLTLLEVAKLTGNNEVYDPSYYVLNSAVENFINNNQDKISKYDQNKDGYLDGVWIIYLNPYFDSTTEKYYFNVDDSFSKPSNKNKLTSLLWAYTYWNYEARANYSSPSAFCYSWASYSFLWDGDYQSDEMVSLVDSHTYIHETGHLLGIDDYYNYDYSTKKPISPTGGVDMMDNNVGDHNSYSKYLLDWIEPKLVKEEGTFHLSSFSETGECLLLPANINTYNNSPFDEYLLFELYTPTSLNMHDSLAPYANGVQMLSDYGVRIYHVDSRIVTMKYDYFRQGFVNNGFSNTYVNKENEYSLIGTSNTPSYSKSGYYLITMLSKEKNSVKNYYYQDKEDGIASNQCLYKNDSYIDSFTFDNGSSLKYRIEISSLNESGVDIIFTTL